MKRMNAVLLAVLACVTVLAAQTGAPSPVPDDLTFDGKVLGKRVPAQPGDICMLCNNPVDKDDGVYLVNGQRVPLHIAEMKAASPERIRAVLAQVRPRGAFLGTDPTQQQITTGWFFFGLYVLAGLIFSALCAHHAFHAGQNPIQWLMAGLFLNVVAYGILLTRPRHEVTAPVGIPRGLRKISATYLPEPCPKCGTENHPTARSCAGCGATLSPKMTSEVARAGLATR